MDRGRRAKPLLDSQMAGFTVVWRVLGVRRAERPRTQVEALAGSQGEAEDKGPRSSCVPASGAGLWNRPSGAGPRTKAREGNTCQPEVQACGITQSLVGGVGMG